MKFFLTSFDLRDCDRPHISYDNITTAKELVLNHFKLFFVCFLLNWLKSWYIFVPCTAVRWRMFVYTGLSKWFTYIRAIFWISDVRSNLSWVFSSYWNSFFFKTEYSFYSSNELPLKSKAVILDFLILLANYIRLTYLSIHFHNNWREWKLKK